MAVAVPKLVGLLFDSGPLQSFFNCLFTPGETPATCSAKSGVRSELTQFLLQTDQITRNPNAPVKLLFRDNNRAPLDIVALHGPLVIFGQTPVAGQQVGPGTGAPGDFDPDTGRPIDLAIGVPMILRITSLLPRVSRFPHVGDRGLEVLELQQALRDRRFGVRTDGIWGDTTTQATIDFQHSQLVHGPGVLPPPKIETLWHAMDLPIAKDGVPGLLDPG